MAMLAMAPHAHAADMPDFLRGSLDGSATTVNWQGFYVGGQAGYGTSNMTFSGSTASIVSNLLANTDLNPNNAISGLPLGGKVSSALNSAICTPNSTALLLATGRSSLRMPTASSIP
jgi:opacity protein-like surface antigen